MLFFKRYNVGYYLKPPDKERTVHPVANDIIVPTEYGAMKKVIQGITVLTIFSLYLVIQLHTSYNNLERLAKLYPVS